MNAASHPMLDLSAETGASISTNQVYRYWLTRRLNLGGRRLLFCMLNPSTADATENDPTIRKCIGFARELGWRHYREPLGCIDVVNAYPYRATEPKELKPASRDEGWLPSLQINDSYLSEAAASATMIIVAWGANLTDSEHVARVLSHLRSRARDPILCLGRTKGGQPRHPLYLPYSTQVEVYEPGAAS